MVSLNSSGTLPPGQPTQRYSGLREEAEQADRSATVRKLLYRAISEWKKEHAAKLYGDGKVTLERAAMEADISVREIMDYMRTKRIPGQYELRDLEEDMARFYERLAVSKPAR